MLAAAELTAGVCLAVQGDHGHAEDLRLPRCLRAGHLPDVLLTSGARQVRRRQPLIYLVFFFFFQKRQATFSRHPDVSSGYNAVEAEEGKICRRGEK